LVYVDDVVSAFLTLLISPWSGLLRPEVAPEYSITLGELSSQIDAFRNCRSTLVSERVGTGLTRALYATYLSYLPKDKFAYEVPAYGDARGIFVEMLKTPETGQFSFFTAHPGVTRGGHYHHTKTEKFLVIKGKARFGFRHMITNEIFYLDTQGAKPQVVETVPGWTHDITNIGSDEMVVMLWANEVFDRIYPDTFACPL
jgi:UDP-2-acetamido-2,6-beta-L-arabino-hexul-4-ose reductase